MELVMSPRNHSDQKSKHQHWRALGENAAVSLKELKMRREILKKCVSKEEYKTTHSVIGDLMSIPSKITDKYRVKQMKMSRSMRHEEAKSESLKVLQRKKEMTTAMVKNRKSQQLKQKRENEKALRRKKSAVDSRHHRESVIKHHHAVCNTFAQLRIHIFSA